MKTCFAVLFIAMAAVVARADVLFSDTLNYPDGLIETNGLWYVYSPIPPNPAYQDAFVVSNLLILNVTNKDEVAAPLNGQGVWNIDYDATNYASFYINVQKLPPLSSGGGYFCAFVDTNSPANTVAHLIVNTIGTVVPGRTGSALPITLVQSPLRVPLIFPWIWPPASLIKWCFSGIHRRLKMAHNFG